MAELERYRKMSPAEKERRRSARKKSICPTNSFYDKAKGGRSNERIESAVNRRAAGVYVQDF